MFNYFKSKKKGSLDTDFSQFISAGEVERTLRRILFGFGPTINTDGDNTDIKTNGFIGLINAFNPVSKEQKSALQCFLLQFINYTFVNNVSFDKIKDLLNDNNRTIIRRLVTANNPKVIFKDITKDVGKLEKTLDVPFTNECYGTDGKLISTPKDPRTKKPITKWYVYKFLKAISDTDTQKNTSLLSEYQSKLDGAVPKLYPGAGAAAAAAAQGWHRPAFNLDVEKTEIKAIIDDAANAAANIDQIRDRTNNIVELIRLYNLLNQNNIVVEINDDGGAPNVPAVLTDKRKAINELFYPDVNAAATHLGANDANNLFWDNRNNKVGDNIQDAIATIKSGTEDLVTRITLFNDLNIARANLVDKLKAVRGLGNNFLKANVNAIITKEQMQTTAHAIKLCDANVVLNGIGDAVIVLDTTTINVAEITAVKDNIKTLLSVFPNYETFVDNTVNGIDIFKNLLDEARRFAQIKDSFKTDQAILNTIIKLIREIYELFAVDAAAAAAAANNAGVAAAAVPDVADVFPAVPAVPAVPDAVEAAAKRFSTALEIIGKKNADLKIRVDNLYERGRKLGTVKGFYNVAILDEYKSKLDGAVPKPYPVAAAAAAAEAQGWPQAATNLDAEKTAIRAIIDDAANAAANIDQIRVRTNNIVELIRLYNLLNENDIVVEINDGGGAPAVPAALTDKRRVINASFFPAAPNADITYLGISNTDNNLFWNNGNVGSNIQEAIATIKSRTEYLVGKIGVYNRLNDNKTRVISNVNTRANATKLNTERTRLNNLLKRDQGDMAEVTQMVDRFLAVVKLHNDNEKNVSESYKAEKEKTDARISKINFDAALGKFDDKDLKKLQYKTSKLSTIVPFSTTAVDGKLTKELQAKYTAELSGIETFGFARFENEKKKIQRLIDTLNTNPEITEENIKSKILSLRNYIKIDKASIPDLEIFSPRVLKLGGDEIILSQKFLSTSSTGEFQIAPVNLKNKIRIENMSNLITPVLIPPEIEVDLLNPYYLRYLFIEILINHFSLTELGNLEITNIEEYDNVFLNFNGKQINIKHVLLLMQELVTLLKRNGYNINRNDKDFVRRKKSSYNDPQFEIDRDRGYKKFMKDDFFSGFLSNTQNTEIAKTFYTITNAKNLTTENAEDNFKLRVQAILGDRNNPDDIYGKVTDMDQNGWLKTVVDQLSTRSTKDKYSTKFLEALEKGVSWTLINGILYNTKNVNSSRTSVLPNKSKLTKKEFYDLFFGEKTWGTAESRIAISTTDRVLKTKQGLFSGGKKTLKKHNGKKHGGKKHGGKNTLKKIYNTTIKKTNKIYQNTTHKNN